MCLKIPLKKNKEYVEGDFSFIKSKHLQYILSYDYKAVYELIKNTSQMDYEGTLIVGNRNSRDSERPNIWDTPIGIDWELISKKVCDAHTEESYYLNIKILNYIHIYGWNNFVKYNPFHLP